MDTLGDRIKQYERASNYLLTPNSPLLIRIDGKSFHTFTKGCDRPFDQKIVDAMAGAALATSKEMSGFKLAYVQSDEATFLLTDFDTHETMGWFNYELNKVVSISASAFTAHFNRLYGSNNAMFDSRAFTVPLEDVPNVFVWRQRDWERNSIQMLARAHFSHRELDRKKIFEIHDMLHEKNINWADLPGQLKNGTYILKDGSYNHEKQDYSSIRELLSF